MNGTGEETLRGEDEEFDAMMARYDRYDRVVATVTVVLFSVGLVILALGQMCR